MAYAAAGLIVMTASVVGVALTLLQAARADGWGASLLTGPMAEDSFARAHLGLGPEESIVGFVHIGTHEGPGFERPRPDVSTLYADYSGPWKE